MSVVRGFEAFAGAYLGQDWDLLGPTIDDAIATFVKDESVEDVAASIAGLEALIVSSMTEDELDHHWIYELHSGYDPRDDDMTYREWFAHALEVLRGAAGTR